MKINTISLARFSLGFGLALGAITLVGVELAHAQPTTAPKVSFPAGLKWQMMPLVTFSFPGYHEGTPPQRQLAGSIWGKDIDALPVNDVKRDRSKFPAFVLLSPTFESSQFRYVFSSMSAAAAVYDKCEDPPNSAESHTPMYSRCPMRVVIEDKATGQKTQQDFPRYCHLFLDDPDQPAAKNHTAVAFDPNTHTAYFRVIQYGKHAPACDRAIRLK